ncbi:MAG: bifunctional riboflavin kinase/FAD synthetase [bacterium]|jgi:riboflavin kinase/FMN adenylyltransferase|nr:bifunctional riboflavin kinase/FAD synthetase [candidate division KSB1 bacterium]MDH7558628.1 bifunctional riboflavin kinase/FAD synthetase [bacterium]
MEIVRSVPPSGFLQSSVVTVGTFDGVHVGHRAIIQRTLARAARKDRPAVVVTFEPHPQLVVRRPDRPGIHLLSTFQEKAGLLEGIGVEFLVALPFTEGLAEYGPAEFVQRVLCQSLGASDVVVGYDHTFGKGRSGTIDTLRTLGAKLHFEVEVVDKVVVDGAPVSSTRIRQLLAQGNVLAAARLLGRNYTVRGTVVSGRGLGRQLGYPTANIRPPKDKLIPQSGIYAVRVEIGECTKRGILNIGVRPTFGGATEVPVLEVHIYDYDGELYGEEIGVEFLGRIRGERRFDSAHDLARQIEADVMASQAFFENTERRD